VKYSINIREMDNEVTRVIINVQSQTRGSFGSWDQQKVTKQNADKLLSPIFDSLSSRLN